jgi:hypothetical protein
MKSERRKLILKYFIHFLKRKHLYNEFVERLESDKYYRREYVSENYTSETTYIVKQLISNPSKLIINAFSWYDNRYEDTSHSKWEKIHEEWREICKSKKFNNNLK